MGKKDLLVYQGINGEILLKEDNKNHTIWANQKQIAEIFGVNRPAITKHLSNIFKTKELTENSVCSKMEHTAEDGKVYKTQFYNLDAIISIGYRINSKQATQFRIWATTILKEHITQGYTINPQRIQHNYDTFLQAVEEVRKLLPKSTENQIQTEDILELIKSFAGTWLSLDSYDKDTLPQGGITKIDIEIHSEELYADIETFKSQLIGKEQATEIFAQEKTPKSLEGILGNIFQSFDGIDVYPSIEEKSAHFLYFIVKNHPFTDGNKRTGAFSFLWFLKKVGFYFESTITPEALTAITLLVAESNPKDKKRIVGLIILLLKK